MKIPLMALFLILTSAGPALAQRDGYREPSQITRPDLGNKEAAKAAFERARSDPRDTDPRPTENNGTRSRDGQKGPDRGAKESKGGGHREGRGSSRF